MNAPHTFPSGRIRFADAAPLSAHFIPWTEDPEAQMLLARCGANPPHGEWKRTVYVQTADEWFEYTGPIADRLTALRDEYGYRALMHFHDTEDYGPFGDFCQSPSVAEAIEEAREADRRQAIMIADGRPSLNPWAAPESGIWL